MLIDTDNHWFPFNKNGKANYERYIGQPCDLQSNIYLHENEGNYSLVAGYSV